MRAAAFVFGGELPQVGLDVGRQAKMIRARRLTLVVRWERVCLAFRRAWCGRPTSFLLGPRYGIGGDGEIRGRLHLGLRIPGELVEWGVTPIILYDPLGRAVRTDLPDGTFVRVRFTPWEQTTHDASDNILESNWYAERVALTPGTPDNDGEINAKNKAIEHADTPTRTLLDRLGRPFVTIVCRVTRNRPHEALQLQSNTSRS